MLSSSANFIYLEAVHSLTRKPARDHINQNLKVRCREVGIFLFREPTRARLHHNWQSSPTLRHCWGKTGKSLTRLSVCGLLWDLLWIHIKSPINRRDGVISISSINLPLMLVLRVFCPPWPVFLGQQWGYSDVCEGEDENILVHRPKCLVWVEKLVCIQLTASFSFLNSAKCGSLLTPT